MTERMYAGTYKKGLLTANLHVQTTLNCDEFVVTVSESVVDFYRHENFVNVTPEGWWLVCRTVLHDSGPSFYKFTRKIRFALRVM